MLKMLPHLRIVCLISCIITLVLFSTCNKIDEFNEDPEITPLQQGVKVTNAIGYSASLALMAFEGQPLPDNVIFEESNSDDHSSSGIIYVDINENYPVPFNNEIGDIVIAGLWDKGRGGVISILFADINLLSSDFDYMGIHIIPLVVDNQDGPTVVFAEEDIVQGAGEDTLLYINLTNFQFDMELERARSPQPQDLFSAIKQNVWYINIDQNNTVADAYDDRYMIYGGGQILEYRENESGGILYHGMIGAEFEYNNCSLNPTDGKALIQNLKGGEKIDLGNIFLEFRNECDGKAHVNLATGKYVKSNGRDVNLNLD